MFRPISSDISYQDWIKRDREIGRALRLFKMPYTRKKRYTRRTTSRYSRRARGTKSGPAYKRRTYTAANRRRMVAGNPNLVKPTSAVVNFKNKNMNDLCAIIDPFTAHRHRPQIHDGTAKGSLGCSIRDVWEVKIPNNSVHYVCLFPGLNAMYSITDPKSAGYGYIRRHNYHGQISDNDLAPEVSGEINKYVFENNYNINRWRMVSQALHIQNMTDDRNNGGWWEAIHCPVPTAITSYFLESERRPFGTPQFVPEGTPNGSTLVFGTVTSQSTNWAFAPVLSELVEKFGDRMSSESSYTRGDLKNIHRHKFLLRPQGNQHEWVPCGQYMETNGIFTPQEALTDGTNQILVQSGRCVPKNPLNNGGQTGDLKFNNLSYQNTDLQGWMYRSMEMILLKIHTTNHFPGVNQAGEPANTVNLVFDCIQNQELILEPKSKLKDFEELHQQHEVYKTTLDWIEEKMTQAGETQAEITKKLTQAGVVADKMVGVGQSAYENWQSLQNLMNFGSNLKLTN
jgi:hypothetical protein